MIPMIMGCCAQGAVGEPKELTTFSVNSTGTEVLVAYANGGPFVVDWGDGTQYSGTILQTKTYTTPGTYSGSLQGPIGGRVTLSGSALTGVQSIEDGLQRIQFWSSGQPSINLISVPPLIPPSITSLTFMFRGATAFNQDLSSWDVSNVTSMDGMFLGASSFNGDLASWDVSNVTNMALMFENATAFNQDLSSWDVSNVTAMDDMFQGTAFNQDISGWDVSNVITFGAMFRDATSFNQDISSWDVSNVTSMNGMFRDATSFNQDLSGWCVSNIPSPPTFFDAGATSWTLPRPVWGTCPNG